MEFEVNGILYKASKLDAMKQFHIVRRLTPMLAELTTAFQGGGETTSALTGLASAISKLSDDDANFVLFGLLKATERKEPNGIGWSKVAINESLMFQDIDMPSMLQIAYNVGVYNFKDFFQKLPSVSVGGSVPQTSPSNG